MAASSPTNQMGAGEETIGRMSAIAGKLIYNSHQSGNTAKSRRGKEQMLDSRMQQVLAQNRNGRGLQTYMGMGRRQLDTGERH